MNLLLAWELGGGLGHVARLQGLGRLLREDGHKLTYAFRNPGAAAQLRQSDLDHAHPAPVMTVMPGSRRAAYDYADLLLLRGYESTERLHQKVAGWLDLIRTSGAECIIADHAPTACLAAHVAGIRSITVGTGFTVAPLTKPLNPLMSNSPEPEAGQFSLENRLDRAVADLLKQYGKPEVDRAVEIMAGRDRYICTYEELDAYGRRPEECYFGDIEPLSAGVAAHWASTSKPRLFVYLQAGVPITSLVIDVLSETETSCLLFLGGPRSRVSVGKQGGSLRMVDAPVDLSTLRGNCDLVLCHGGQGTLAAALLAGIPTVTLPLHIEQYMTASRLAALGSSRLVELEATRADIRNTVVGMVGNSVSRAAASGMAEKYAGFSPLVNAERLAGEISAEL